MKKKIKEWLIHKLGGYTEKEIIPPLPNVTIYRNEKRVKRICSIQKLDIQLPVYLIENLRKKLTDGLAKEIMKQHFKVKEEKIGINWVYSMELEYLEQEVDEE